MFVTPEGLTLHVNASRTQVGGRLEGKRTRTRMRAVEQPTVGRRLISSLPRPCAPRETGVVAGILAKDAAVIYSVCVGIAATGGRAGWLPTVTLAVRHSSLGRYYRYHGG